MGPGFWNASKASIAWTCLVLIASYAPEVSASSSNSDVTVKLLEELQLTLNAPSISRCDLNDVKTAPPAASRRCDEATVVEVPKSPNTDRFRSLLKQGMSAPLQEFLILWDPANNGLEENNYFDECWDPKNYGRPTRNSDGIILPSCSPDVLYSWGPKEKLTNMERAISGDTWQESPNPGYRRLWTTLSPVSSFPYGSWPVRIKINRDTLFVLGGNRGNSSIYVANRARLNDYVIRDSRVIESWSYGTPEHYDEIVKDLKRLFSKKKFVGYDMKPAYTSQTVNELLFEISVPEGGPPTEATLKKSLLEMIRMILAGEGRIHYAPGVCRNRELHFATDRPTYFNER